MGEEVIVAEYFDEGRSRRLLRQDRPPAASLLAAVQDPTVGKRGAAGPAGAATKEGARAVRPGVDKLRAANQLVWLVCTTEGDVNPHAPDQGFY